MKTKFLLSISISIVVLHARSQPWSPVGTGLNGLVVALTVYKNELYAGGLFTMAGGGQAANIAKWNGTTWMSVGSGTNGMVYSLVVYNGELYAGGSFTLAGGFPVNYVAKWNDTAWSDVGMGYFNNFVYALTVHDGKICAAGEFTLTGDAVALWNGTLWTSFYGGLSPTFHPPVYALTSHNGELYAGISDNGCIVKWNAASGWVKVGGGFGSGSSGCAVRSLVSNNGSLYAGGDFAARIAKWSNSSWLPLETGVGGFSDAKVRSLAVYNGKLQVGGWFTTAGISQANFVATWNDTTWSSAGVGLNGDVHALAVYNGTLYAGGNFIVSGEDTVNHIAKWSDNNVVAHNSKAETVNTAGGFYYDHGNAIVSDNLNNMYVTGGYRGQAYFQDTLLTASGINAAPDAFIARYSAKGDLIWIKKISGTIPISGNAEGISITIDSSNNIIATGQYIGTAALCDSNYWENGGHQIYIVKYDSSGNCLWNKSTKVSTCRPLNIKTDHLDNVYLYGSFAGGIRWGLDTLIYVVQGAGDDVFTAKFDKDGNFLWIRQIGSPQNELGGSLIIDGQQNIIVTGTFSGNAKFNDQVYLNLYGIRDMFIAKYDPNGNLLWARQAGGEGHDVGIAVAADGANNYYVLGVFTDSAKFSPSYTIKNPGPNRFIAKYSEQGTFLWVKIVEKFSFNSIAYGVKKSGGYLYLTGTFDGVRNTPNSSYFSFAGSVDGILATYDLNGNFLSGNQIGGTYQDACLGLSYNNHTKDLCVIGYYSNSLSFPDTSITSRGNWDVYFLRYTQNDSLVTEVKNNGKTQINISLYPNPSSGKFSFKSYGPLIENFNLEIYNLLGEKIHAQTIQSERSEIDLSKQPNGIYFLQLKSEKEALVKKLIIQK